MRYLLNYHLRTFIIFFTFYFVNLSISLFYFIKVSDLYRLIQFIDLDFDNL